RRCETRPDCRQHPCSRSGTPATSTRGFASREQGARPKRNYGTVRRKGKKMTYKTIIYEKKDERVAVITLNRPDKFNTIRAPMPDEIQASIGEANQDRDVRVILLQGAGK